MDNKERPFILDSGVDGLSLRTIFSSDCERMRIWKNEHRLSFFFQELISPQMQAAWYVDYLNRADDYLFVVQHDNFTIGCMGFRLIDKKVDIYNVILGDPDYGGKGYMGKALQLMCSYIMSSYTHSIGLKVLKSNPALNWYLKNGFYRAVARENFLELKLNTKKFHQLKFQKTFIRLP